VPPADKDGKKTGPASPLDDFQMGADEFDWDKAIDEWDPTFIAESSALPPEISGVVVAQPPEAGLPLPPGPAAALKEAAAALPAPLPPLEGEAAPLPPPPPLVLEPPPALQIDIDLTKTPLPTENVDATLSMDATEMDRLAALLRRPEAAAAPAQPVASVVMGAGGGAAPAAVTEKPAEEEDFYDNMVVVPQTETSSSAKTPAVRDLPSFSTPRQSQRTPQGLPTMGEKPVAAAPISGSPQSLPPPPVVEAPSEPSQQNEDFGLDIEIGSAAPIQAELPPASAAPAAAEVIAAAAAVVAARPEPAVEPKPAVEQPAPAPAPVAAAPVATPAPAPVAVSGPVSAPPPAAEPPQAAAPVAAPAAVSQPTAAPPVVATPVVPPASVGSKPLPGAAPAAPIPMVVRRLPLPSFDALPKPVMNAPGASAAPEAATRRHFLALLDAEAAHHANRNKRRAARLSVAAARQSESLREPADALDRYRNALDADPLHRAALRGTRRVLSWPGPTAQPDEATTLLERELECSSPAERQGLLLSRSELLRLQGQMAEAKLSFQEALPASLRPAASRQGGAAKGAATSAGGLAALAGLLDIATAQSAQHEQSSAIDQMLDAYATSGALRTVLQLERARIDETAGRDSAAAARYEAVFNATSGGSLSAGLGWLRTAVRLPRSNQGQPPPLARAYQALLGAQLATGLRAAVRRQVALSQQASPAARAVALQAADLQADWLVTEELALTQEQASDFAGAAATYRRLAETAREPLHRIIALTKAGEAHERAGDLEGARAALTQAQQQAANADLDYDVIAGRALARISRTLGKPEDMLALFSLPMGHAVERAAYTHYLAAKILLGLPAEDTRRAGALTELQASLQARPDYAPAVRMITDLLVAEGRHAEAARVLVRAAEAMTDDSSHGQPQTLVRRGYREEAVRLLARAGEAVEAARLLVDELAYGATTGAASHLPALRWQLAALTPELVGKADRPLAEQVAAALAEEAEQTTSAHRAATLWYERGLLLLAHHPNAVPNLGEVEQSWQKALASEPLHGPALLSLHLRALTLPNDALAHSPLIHVICDTLRLRMDRAGGRPEAMLWALRLGAAQEHEARNAADALLTYKHLRTFAPDHSVLIGLEDTLFVTAWRAGHALDLLERQLQTEEDPDQRYALLMLAGEQLEAQSQLAKAAERFAQALELRPAHPVAKAALIRAYQSAGMLDELARFTAQELKEATDVQTRVAAYERQALLATQRGAAGSDDAIAAYRNVLTIDTNNHAAMRALERHFIASQQWGELVHLYEQMGLCATDTAFGVHIHLDRARLRQRLVWQGAGDASTLTNELENDFRLALYRDRHSRPALRYLLTTALRKRDLAQVEVLSTSVAELSAAAGDFPGTEHGDSRAAAVFMTRAAEATAADGSPPQDVIAKFQAALKHSPEHLPALRGLLHYAILQRQFAAVADCAEALAQHLRDNDERYLHYMLAGVVSQELLKDRARSQRAFLAGLRLLPEREEAFERLRQAYVGQTSTKEGAAALAELLTERLRHHSDSDSYQSSLRLELAQLLAGPLGDRERAKAELRRAVEQAPNYASALYALGKLLADDTEWAGAVELLERYSQLEQRPQQLVALHLLLADIYSDQLKQPQKATTHFTKVLQLQPQNQLALNKLADVFLAQQKPAGALPILRRLVKYTDDKAKKIGFFHRIAALSELSGDNRGALEALRQAVDVDPINLPALGELAKFYDRQKDTQSMRILLDRAASRFRPLLREKPRDPAVLQALLQIFIWRRATDLAQATAAALITMGTTLPAELKAEVDKLPARKDPTREGLRDPSIDDSLFPPRVAPGFRMLFKLLAEPLAKLYGTDSKKLAALGIDKREKLPRSGHPVRDLANKIAADMGIGEFDIYVTSAQRQDEDGKKSPFCTIEPTDPPALILSSSLLEGSETEKRFIIGGLLKLLQSSLVLPLSMPADELGLLIGALVRQFVPTYTPIGYAEKRIANEAARLKRAIPSKVHGQLLPHAMECSSEALDFDGIAKMLIQSSHHAGLVLTTDMATAISALRRKGSSAERYIDELIRFAVSDEFAELRRIVTGGK